MLDEARWAEPETVGRINPAGLVILRVYEGADGGGGNTKVFSERRMVFSLSAGVNIG